MDDIGLAYLLIAACFYWWIADSYKSIFGPIALALIWPLLLLGIAVGKGFKHE